MTTPTPEHATVRRMIDVLFDLKTHPNIEVRTHVNEVLDTLCEVSIFEVFGPILARPREQLLPFERLLRNRLTLTILHRRVECEAEQGLLDAFEADMDEAVTKLSQTETKE